MSNRSATAGIFTLVGSVVVLMLGLGQIRPAIGDAKAAPAARTTKFAMVSMTLAGWNETKAQQKDYKMSDGKVESFNYKEGGSTGNDKQFGSRVLAVTPVIQDHHADVQEGRKWWREWGGYFGSAGAETNKVMVGGSPQEKGRWPIDLLVIYEE